MLSPHLLLQISFCVYTILGVVKRARWPAATEEAKAGGFFLGYLPSGTPMYRNPCTEQVLKLFDNLLALIRWVKLIWNNLCWLTNIWQPNCDKYLEWSEHVCPSEASGNMGWCQCPSTVPDCSQWGMALGKLGAFWIFIGLACNRPSKLMGACAGVASPTSSAVVLPPT